MGGDWMPCVVQVLEEDFPVATLHHSKGATHNADLTQRRSVTEVVEAAFDSRNKIFK